MTRRIILYVIAALFISAISYNTGYIIALKKNTLRVEEKNMQDSIINHYKKIINDNNLNTDTDNKKLGKVKSSLDLNKLSY